MEMSYKFDEYTDIITFEYLKELKDRRDLFLKWKNENNRNWDISEIYKSPISYSFRVMENGITRHFLQVIKD